MAGGFNGMGEGKWKEDGEEREEDGREKPAAVGHMSINRTPKGKGLS